MHTLAYTSARIHKWDIAGTACMLSRHLRGKLRLFVFNLLLPSDEI